MKKFLIVIFGFLLFSHANAETVIFPDAMQTEDSKTQLPEKETTKASKHNHDYTGSFWILYGINGSLIFVPNNDIVKQFEAVTGESPTINTGFVAPEFRLGYQINPWLGLWAGGIYVPFFPSWSEIVRKTEQVEIIPGLVYTTKHTWYKLMVDIKYTEYFAGTRMRIGEAGGLFFIPRLLGADGMYWFMDFGVTHRRMDVTYSGFFEFKMDPYTEQIRKNAPYFGFGTEIMLAPNLSVNIDASATDFLSKIGTFGMSILFKRYF